MIRALIHEHDEDVRDVTRYVTACTYSETVEAGGSSASVSLVVPFAEWWTFRPGAWLEIVDAKTRVRLWWGYVVGFSTGLRVGGPTPSNVRTMPVQVEARSWVHLLQNARIVLAPGINLDIPGAVYQFDSWGPSLRAWLSSLSVKTPGALLTAIFATLARQKIPETLGGGTLASRVTVGWDRTSVPGARQSHQINVWGLSLNAFGNVLPTGTIWSAITGTFMGDPSLIELFDTLDSSGAPFLLYRVAPLSRVPVSAPLFQVDEAAPEVIDGVEVETLRVSGYRTVGAEHVIAWNASWSDAERKNGFFAQTAIQGPSQLPAYGVIGTPIIDPDDAEAHGLRMYDAHWPFFPASEDLPAEIDQIVDLAAHMLQGGHEYANGSITLGPEAPTVRAGQWVDVELGHADGKAWSCYPRSVQTTIHVDPDRGMVSRLTTVQYTRGSWSDERATPKRRIGDPVPDVVIDARGIA